MSFHFNVGDRLLIRPKTSLPGKGMSYGRMIVTGTDEGRGGSDAGWDVYDGRLDDGREVSFYGFSVVKRLPKKRASHALTDESGRVVAHARTKAAAHRTSRKAKHSGTRVGNRAVGLAKIIFSRSHRPEILHGMARAAFVNDWAQRQEAKPGFRGWQGAELMDIAPKTSARANKWAKALASAFEQKNGGRSLDDLYAEALNIGGSGSPETFGHYLAMQAMGHGVSWFDNNPKFDLHIPRSEFYS
jgi:hypothetical protein